MYNKQILELGKYMSANNIVDLAPQMIRLAAKVIRFSQGGFTPEEKKELAADLLELSLLILEESKK